MQAVCTDCVIIDAGYSISVVYLICGTIATCTCMVHDNLPFLVLLLPDAVFRPSPSPTEEEGAD